MAACFVLITGLLTAVSPFGTSVAAGLPSGFTGELVISAGIEQSTAVLPLDDGRVMVAERNGSVELVDPTGPSATRSRYINLDNVDTDGEKGLLNMVLDPQFATNEHFYVYYHNALTDRARISRFTGDGDTAATSTEMIIWEDPITTSNQVISDHWGGGLSFGPDNNLYVTIGDKKDVPNEAQDLTLAAGKVLRLDPSGADAVGPWVVGQDNPHMIPADNPFIDGPGGNLDEVWALGLRNPFRAKWDIPGGRFFISEVGGNVQNGANASHEDLHMVTLADGGANFGWPSCEGPDCDGPPPANYSAPIFSIQHPDSRAMMLGPVYRGNSFPPEFDEAVFMFDFVFGWLRYVKVDANGQVDPSVPVGGIPFGDSGDLDKPLDMAVGVDGELWWVGGGALHRIKTNNSLNLPPEITEVTATPDVSSAAPAVVQFNATANDPEGVNLDYLWEFGDGNTSTEEDPSHTYQANGTFSAVLTVSDGTNTTVSPEVPVVVGIAPVVTIEEPVDGITFRAGDQITARATATDDGPLDDSSFTWTIGFFHDNHVHPVLTDAPGVPCAPAGSSCITLEVPDTGHDFSGDTSFKFEVTATDSGEAVDVTFDTDIPGFTGSVLLDQLPLDVPIVIDTVIDFIHTVEAPAVVTSGGMTYEFLQWNTGETNRVLTVTVPDVDASYIAQYELSDEPPTEGRVTQGLQAEYRFEDGVGSTVADSSGSGIDLTIADPAAVTWGAGSLVVDSETVISSGVAATSVNDSIEASGELTFEAWVEPADLVQSGPARVLTLSKSSTRRNATLGQGESGSQGGDVWSLRLRSSSTSKNGTPSVRTPAGSVGGDLDHVVYTRDAAGVVNFWIDGALVETDSVTGDLANWDSSYQLALANEVNGSRPWLGTLELVAVYDRALSPTEVAQNFAAGPDGNDAEPPVGDPPVAVDDALSTDEDTAVGGNLLADNGAGADSDPDGDAISVTAVDGDQGAVGTPTLLASGAEVTVDSNGDLSYDPNGAFEYLGSTVSVVDQFQYTVGDGNGGFESATVSVTLNGVNDAPVLNGIPDPNILEGVPQDIPISASDIDGDSMALSLVAGAPPFVSLSDAGDGTGTLTIAPVAGDAGSYTVIVDVVDDGTPTLGDTYSLTVTVGSQPNPPVAADDTFATDENSSVSGNVLADNGAGVDTDPDGDPLSVAELNGSAAAVGQPTALPSGAVVTLNSAGDLIYSPGDTFDMLGSTDSAVDSFEYTVSDGFGGTDTGTITVNLSGLNDAPVIAAIADVSAQETTTIDIGVSATDVDGDELTLALGAGAPAFVSLTDAGDGTGTITIAPAAGDEGSSTVTILVDDDGSPALGDSVTFTVTVTTEPERVLSGLLALYTFDDGAGTTVSDSSGSGPDLVIADAASVTWGSGSLMVDSPTSIASVGAATGINTAVEASNEVTVEAWLTPADTTQTGPARAVTLSQNSRRRNVTLGQGDSGRQVGDVWSVRLRSTSTSKNGTPSVRTPAGSVTGALTHVLYVREASGTVRFYVDGVLVATDQIGGDLSNWDDDYGLTLANEADGGRPWLGSFDLVAIYDRALTPAEVLQNHGAGPG